MNIYTAYTQSHQDLADFWVGSMANDPDLVPSTTLIDVPNDGNYGNQQWKMINELAVLLLIDTLRSERGNCIGLTGVDVVVLKPVTGIVESLLADCDVLMQRERLDAELINPDVSFFRVTDPVISGMERFYEHMGEWDGHLPQQDAMYREFFPKIKLLPVEFSCPTNGGLREDSVLFHANCTQPRDGRSSVEQKTDMLRHALGAVLD